MKTSLCIAALLSLALHTAHAQTDQQNRMTLCNSKAGALKGDERKAFMKSCLSKPKISDAQREQRERMKTCNAQATDKTGDDRKAFMSSCLKKN